MSRIYRSRDIPADRVTKLSLDEKGVSDPEKNRPKGGVLWLGRGQGGGTSGSASNYGLGMGEAARVVEHARTEAQRIEQEAYHEGFAQGEAAGKKLAALKIEPVMKELTSLMESFGNEKRLMIEQNESELIKIAFLIAMKILHREIDQSTDGARNVVEAALEKVVKADKVVVKLSPYDLEMIQQQASESGDLPKSFGQQVELVGDFDISRGGCKVSTDTGEIDATIENQIKYIQSILWSE